jgi:hypothetical protein
MMIRKSYRLLFALIAFILGAIIVYMLSFAGNKSKGPIENLLTTTSTVVQDVEQDIIVQPRKVKRSDKLDWLVRYMKNPALLKKPKVILLGAYDNGTAESFDNIVNLEDSLKTTFPLIQIYTAWGSKDEEQFPDLQVQAILELGSIPVITWEPWLTDFDLEKFPTQKNPDDRDKGGMMDIANGNYDSYIKEWAIEAKAVRRPIFLRLGHEMNDPYRYPWGPQNNTAKDFIAAWQHIHQLFTAVGANNIIWVWSPHPAYGFFTDYYPGNDCVDYVGIGTLNYGTVASWSSWWSFSDIFGKYYEQLAAFGKPIMLSEFGSLAVGGSRSKWYGEALADMPEKYPAVKSILFFHDGDDKSTTQQTLNWKIINDSAVKKSITDQINLWPDSLKPKTGSK